MANTSPPRAALVTRSRRRLHLTRVVAVDSAKRTLLPPRSAQSRRRTEMCGAANVLVALGVRVDAIPPSVPWPRTGRLVVSDSTFWLGDLAVLTAVAGAPVVRAGDARLLQAGTTACPVLVRYRVGDVPLDDDAVPRTRGEILATEGLVVEVRCLPPLHARISGIEGP